MRHVQSTGGGPCFFCQTLRRSCTDAASSRPWAVELRLGGLVFRPPWGGLFNGEGGRRSRGNPKGVPLARFGRGKFSTASAGQLSAKRYRKNLKAKTYRFRGGAIRRDEGGRFGVKSSAEGGAIRRDEGGRFGVNNSLFPQLYQHGTSLSSECVPVPIQKERGGDSAWRPAGGSIGRRFVLPLTRQGRRCLAPGWRKARAVWKVAACGQSRRVRARRREPGRASRFSRQRKSPTG